MQTQVYFEVGKKGVIIFVNPNIPVDYKWPSTVRYMSDSHKIGVESFGKDFFYLG